MGDPKSLAQSGHKRPVYWPDHARVRNELKARREPEDINL